MQIYAARCSKSTDITFFKHFLFYSEKCVSTQKARADNLKSWILFIIKISLYLSIYLSIYIHIQDNKQHKIDCNVMHVIEWILLLSWKQFHPPLLSEVSDVERKRSFSGLVFWWGDSTRVTLTAMPSLIIPHVMSSAPRCQMGRQSGEIG